MPQPGTQAIDPPAPAPTEAIAITTAAPTAAPAAATTEVVSEAPGSSLAADASKPAEALGVPAATEAAKPIEYARFEDKSRAPVMGDMLTKFHALGTKHNLPQEVMQEVINWRTEVSTQDSVAYDALVAKNTEVTISEFGGEHREANENYVRKAWAFIGSPELDKLFTQVRLTNHPDVIRMLVGLGKRLGEDTTRVAGNVVAAPRSVEMHDILYTNTPQHKI